VTAALRRLLRRLLAWLGRAPRPDAAAPREEQGGGAPAPGADELAERERQMIDRVLRLGSTRAWDVMTPRVDMLAWPASMTLAELAPQLPAVRYSRVPVFREGIDDVVGVLYTREAYQALVSGQRDVTLGELAREPFFVPGSVALLKLLSDFQQRRIHMGVVIDEYGGTDGLVTLEDILEELVGEIVDETDLEEQPVVRVSRNEVLAEGYADLREVNHFFNTGFPQLEHRSVNGYVLEELGYVPRAGTELEREGMRIRVEDASETQVLRVRITRPHLADDERAHPGADAHDDGRSDGGR
jgi:CBS domain containing-hemolysin-like protein